MFWKNEDRKEWVFPKYWLHSINGYYEKFKRGNVLKTPKDKNKINKDNLKKKKKF